MQLVDTHCHLDVAPLGGAAEAVLARARAQGVTAVVALAYDLASWPAVRALAAHPGVFTAFGLHPWVAHEPLAREALAAELETPKCVAIGEIGLDFKIEGYDARRQIEVLTAQLELAVELDRPVLLHCRGAFEEMLALLARFAPRLRGVAHAFSRGPELAQRFLDLGLYVAFGGAVTQSRDNRAQKSAACLPLDRLLLETDAPSIGVEGTPAERTEPRHVAEVAAAVARLRGVPVEEVARQTTANARALLRF